LRSLNIEAKQNALDRIVDPLRRQRAELSLQRDKLIMSRDAVKKASESHGRFTQIIDSNRAALRDWLLIIDPLARGFHFLASKAMEMGSAIRKAVGFREQEMIGLETFLGSGAGGLLDKMESLAAKTGRSTEELTGWAKSLAQAGMAAKDIGPVMDRLAGMENITAGAGGTIGRVIANIFSAGKGGAGDVEALRGTGIRVEKLYEDISERFTGIRNRIAGKMIAENELGLGKNLLTSMILREADLLNATEAGKAGGRTLEGRIKAFGTNVDAMFASLAKSSGIAAFKGVLSNLADMFDPGSKSGKSMMGRLTSLSDTLSRALEPLTGTEGKARMEAFFASLTRVLEGIVPLLEKAARYTEILVHYAAGGHAPGAPASMGEEVSQLWDWMAGVGKEAGMALFGSTNAQYPAPFKQFGQPVYGGPISVSVQVDARGSSEKDAERIGDKTANKVREVLQDELHRMAVQAGAETP
jgi:hypothetical protein